MRSSYRLRTRLTSNHENHFHVSIQRFEIFILRENNFGDLYLEVNVIIPESLSKEQRSLLEKLKILEDQNNSSEIKNFINKAKKFWDNKN